MELGYTATGQQDGDAAMWEMVRGDGAACGELLGSLLGGTNLNYIGHRACMIKSSEGSRKERERKELEEMEICKVVAGGQEREQLHRETRNGDWITTMFHQLNGTELSWE